MCHFRQTYWPNNGLSFALTSRQHVLPCYLRILCLRHNTPYVRWHALHTPPFCKQGLSATVFGRKQTRISRIYSQHFPMHSRDVIWKIKPKSTFPVSFSLVSAEMNLLGNYRTLRGLRTVIRAFDNQITRKILTLASQKNCMPNFGITFHITGQLQPKSPSVEVVPDNNVSLLAKILKKTMSYHLRWCHISTCRRVMCAYNAYVTIHRTLGVTCFESHHFVNKVSGQHFSAENWQTRSSRMLFSTFASPL